MISPCFRRYDNLLFIIESLPSTQSVCMQPLQGDVVGLYAASSSTNTRYHQRCQCETRPRTDINGIDNGYNLKLCPLPDLYCAKTRMILFVTGTS